MANSLSDYLRNYGQQVKDRATHPLETINNGLYGLVNGSPSDIASNLSGGGLAGMVKPEMAQLMREAQLQIQAENAARNSVKTIPDTNSLSNAATGIGSFGAGVGTGYLGTGAVNGQSISDQYNALIADTKQKLGYK